MTAAVDAELGGWRARALERHLASCAGCRREHERSQRLDALLAALPTEAPVSARLEQDTLRRVRIAAAEQPERGPASGWQRWITVPALAAAAVLAVAVGVSRMPPAVTESPAPATPVPEIPVAAAPAPPPAAPQRVARVAPKARDEAPARRVEPVPEPETPVATAQAPRALDPSRRPDLSSEPPADLAAAPDLFMDLNLLRNMEKLQHYEAIETTTLHGRDGESPNG